MSRGKLLVACGLTTLVISACGMSAKPPVGTPDIAQATGNHAQVTDPRTKHVKCLKADGLPIRLFRASGARPAFQVGTAPTDPTVIFEPTQQAATGVQIVGQAQGAEVIGAALVYPNQASDSVIQQVENCMAIGVNG
ncbi:MAG TPA: hypothetical protein VG321_06930 [Solirubrobacteraceae bacterium]|jgi:hypothetical protein|nr:hypothetical protein [Solirubrobacteraceae bacterium]